jgi:hypothetical protein
VETELEYTAEYFKVMRAENPHIVESTAALLVIAASIQAQARSIDSLRDKMSELPEMLAQKLGGNYGDEIVQSIDAVRVEIEEINSTLSQKLGGE